MKRTNFSIKESQVKQLKEHYEETGTRMSEAVRRGIDLYFEKQKRKDGKSSNK